MRAAHFACRDTSGPRSGNPSSASHRWRSWICGRLLWRTQLYTGIWYVVGSVLCSACACKSCQQSAHLHAMAHLMKLPPMCHCDYIAEHVGAGCSEIVSICHLVCHCPSLRMLEALDVASPNLDGSLRVPQQDPVGGASLQMQAHRPCSRALGLLCSAPTLKPTCGLANLPARSPPGLLTCAACPAGPQLLQNGGGIPLRSTQTAKPNLYTLPDCLYTIPASKPCAGPTSVGCSVPGSCTANQLPGGCCQLGFKCT